MAAFPTPTLRSALYKAIFRPGTRSITCSHRMLATERREEKSSPTNLQGSRLLSLPAFSVAVAAASSSVGVAFAESTSATVLPASVVWALKVAPPACFFFLQVSGLKTVQEIKRNQSTGNLSSLPFLSLATNCVVWSLYGALVSDLTVLLPNLSGAALGMYYTYVFNKHSRPGSMTPKLLGAGSIMGAAGAMALMLPAQEAAQYIGYTGCTLAVILMASPLATMATVLRDKSTAAMPFVTSLATFANASAWAGYGIFVAHDPIIWGPNILGLVAACVQLSLFWRFGIHSSESK